MTWLTFTASSPGPAVHVAPITAVGESIRKGPDGPLAMLDVLLKSGKKPGQQNKSNFFDSESSHYLNWIRTLRQYNELCV